MTDKHNDKPAAHSGHATQHDTKPKVEQHDSVTPLVITDSSSTLACADKEYFNRKQHGHA